MILKFDTFRSWCILTLWCRRGFSKPTWFSLFYMFALNVLFPQCHCLKFTHLQRTLTPDSTLQSKLVKIMLYIYPSQYPEGQGLDWYNLTSKHLAGSHKTVLSQMWMVKHLTRMWNHHIRLVIKNIAKGRQVHCLSNSFYCEISYSVTPAVLKSLIVISLSMAGYSVQCNYSIMRAIFWLLLNGHKKKSRLHKSSDLHEGYISGQNCCVIVLFNIQESIATAMQSCTYLINTEMQTRQNKSRK